jgi:hypothetical protein
MRDYSGVVILSMPHKVLHVLPVRAVGTTATDG